MPLVPTARGDVDTGALGAVLMHEHVFVLSPEFETNYPDDAGFDEDREVDEAVLRLEELVAGGIDTIVDLTVVGLGRDVRLIQRVNERTSLQIVVATGLYTFTELPLYIKVRSGRGDATDLMAELFIHDIAEGI